VVSVAPAMLRTNALRAAVTHRYNILVAGGTSSGKTTLAYALLAEMAWVDARIILIEDTRELQKMPAARHRRPADAAAWRRASNSRLSTRLTQPSPQGVPHPTYWRAPKRRWRTARPIAQRRRNLQQKSYLRSSVSDTGCLSSACPPRGRSAEA
jgi:hypothetical protein